ncbi:MAG: aspartyl protease family protein [Thermosynechococcaceae cyanobacterium]
MKHQLIIFLLAAGLGLGLGGVIRYRLQNTPSAQIEMSGDSVEIPFEIYGRHLFLKGRLNDTTPSDWILDSGAADVFINEAKTKALQLKPPTHNLLSGDWGSRSTTDVSGVVLQLGPLILRDRESAKIPPAEMDGLNQYFGRRFDGILGYEFFEQLVTEIDFRRRQVRLFRPQTYRYQGTGLRIPLQMDGDRPYVEATISPYGLQPLKGRFLIDTGSNGALGLTASCGLDRRLIAAAPRTLARPLTTFTGTEEVVLGRVQKIQMGSLQIEQPLTVFGANTSGVCDRVAGKIGNQILQQFKTILDYPQRQMILEPYATPPIANAYEYDLSGLWLQATGPQLNTYRIGAVYANTPAAAAKIQPGDVLKQIDGQPATQFSLAQLRQHFSQSGQTINVTIERNKQAFSARFLLRPLL